MCLYIDSKLSPSEAVSDKLGQTVTSVLDSDDESLAEFIGQLSPSHKPAGARSTANQVSSGSRSNVKGYLLYGRGLRCFRHNFVGMCRKPKFGSDSVFEKPNHPKN